MSIGAISRRQFGALTAGALASMATAEACQVSGGTATSEIGSRLRARPVSGVKTVAKGTSVLGLDASRDAILQVPAVAPDVLLPLIVLLHGAGGRADRLLERFGSAPADTGVAVLAPDSRGSTWDAIRYDFGLDVAFLDRALERVFATVAVDPARVAIGGFSDGATYGLSLGLINGDLFRTIVAFSPGFVVDGPPQGKPRVFVSHGRGDTILPIDRCSRVIVPGLQRRGHDVTFREFDGGHEVPAAIAQEGFRFVLS
jgi:predicted esterase